MARERWGSRIGLILAMAGNAVGLGNFLRFPVQAAQNGGGAFMIPYFIAFLLMAVPLMWVEWTIGRYGGKYQHGSLPGMFDSMWQHPVSKYLGVIGLFISTIIMIYYTYIESWTLGFSAMSLVQTYSGLDTFDSMKSFLGSYQGISKGYFDSIITSYIFFLITMGANFYILWKGISGGIEKLAKIALPLLYVFGLGLVIMTFSIGTPNAAHPDNNVWRGFAYIWNPNFAALSDSKIWLAAAGQVFFTLSVGMGTLQAYASYLREKDDVVLSGLTTSFLNEFAEVIIGGSIAIPIAVAFFGLMETQNIAAGGAFDLGFVSMSVIFQKIPFGNIAGFIWFLLLFFAGITSSVAMAQPLISFIKEQFKISHKKAVLIVGIIIFAACHLVIFYMKYGFLDEMDYWAGTFGLVLIALIEVVIFAWIFGIDKGWKEMMKGSELRVTPIFKYIIKYVTPIYLIFILGFWTYQDALPTLLFSEKAYLANDVRLLAPKEEADHKFTKTLKIDEGSKRFEYTGKINNIHKDKATIAGQIFIFDKSIDNENLKKGDYVNVKGKVIPKVDEENRFMRNMSRLFMLFVFITLCVMVHYAWKRNKFRYDEGGSK